MQRFFFHFQMFPLRHGSSSLTKCFPSSLVPLQIFPPWHQFFERLSPLSNVSCVFFSVFYLFLFFNVSLSSRVLFHFPLPSLVCYFLQCFSFFHGSFPFFNFPSLCHGSSSMANCFPLILGSSFFVQYFFLYFWTFPRRQLFSIIFQCFSLCRCSFYLFQSFSLCCGSFSIFLSFSSFQSFSLYRTMVLPLSF